MGYDGDAATVATGSAGLLNSTLPAGPNAPCILGDGVHAGIDAYALIAAPGDGDIFARAGDGEAGAEDCIAACQFARQAFELGQNIRDAGCGRGEMNRRVARAIRGHGRQNRDRAA